MIDASDRRRILNTTLDHQCSLSRRGHHQVKRNQFGRRVLQPLKSDGSKDDGVVLAALHLLQAGFDIAANVGDLKVGPQMQGLRGSAPRTSADPGALRQIQQSYSRTADERVPDIATRKIRGQRRPLRDSAEAHPSRSERRRRFRLPITRLRLL